MCSVLQPVLNPLQLLDVSPNLYLFINSFSFFHSQVKAEAEKKPDVMTLSDSDDVQTISSGSDDNKEKERVPLGKNATLAMAFGLIFGGVSPPSRRSATRWVQV